LYLLVLRMHASVRGVDVLFRRAVLCRVGSFAQLRGGLLFDAGGVCCLMREGFAVQVGSDTTAAGMTFTPMPPQETGALFGGGTTASATADASATVKAQSAAAGLVAAASPMQMLPYPDCSFDLVTALMTLHHVRHQKPMFDEIRRVLRPGGVLVFREHDCHSRPNAAVLDLMHGIHHRSWAPANHRNYRPRGWLAKNYVGWYQSAEGWNMLATAAGSCCLLFIFTAFLPHFLLDAFRLLRVSICA
jgi:SAM-dependent methyltransferase